MSAGPEAGDAAPSFNVNFEKEKVKYEDQIERQGRHYRRLLIRRPRPDDGSWPDGQDIRLSRQDHYA